MFTLALAHIASFAAGANSADAEPAIKRGLAYIASEGVKWKDERDCASCHHVPMAVWTLNEAKTGGFAIDEQSLTNLSSWLLADNDPGKVLPAQINDRPEPSLAAIYATLAAQSADRTDAENTNAGKFAAHLVAKQKEDGSWLAPGGRPPILARGDATTILTGIALLRAQVEGADAGAKKAEAWLAAQPPSEETPVYSLRLLLAARAGTDNAALISLMDALVARQNDDGGWSQSTDMASDAYATGQALYALASARWGYDFPATARGMAFLAKTQRDDGSWAMISRPVDPGGAPAKNLDPITFMGSAWGMLGLIKASTLP